ncbi:MAG: hypothetical protein IT458_06090 [Planctomycetes bacterium]|nr:hypothetical protein [Planctomycetota bacterium]
MRATSLGLAVALVTTGIAAQAIKYNPVNRNNTPYFQGGALHPVTGAREGYPQVNPDAFNSASTVATGVPAGTLSWRWIPSETNLRFEPRKVSGLQIGLRASYSTPSTSFPLAVYVPEIGIWVPKARAAGGYDPDLSQAPIFTLARSAASIQSFNSSYVTTRTLGTVVTVNQREMVLSARWEGGEHRDKPGTQGLIGTARDGVYVPYTVGFTDPANGSVIPNPSSDISVLWLFYTEDQATAAAKSDWGRRRNIAQPPYSGYSIGTAQSDLATSQGEFGYDVWGGTANAGAMALPLFNFGPVFTTGVPVLGLVLEVNVTDPLLGLFASAGYTLTLDQTGFAAGPMLSFPPTPSLLGQSLGMEFVLVQLGTATLVDSTQSVWFTVTR